MNIEGLYNHNSSNAPTLNQSLDDGHIVVCVRIRNVPSILDISHYEMQKNTRPLSHSQRICVSVIENIVVMHDPKSIDDACALERDSIHVAHLLTDSVKCSSRSDGMSYSGKKRSYSIHSRSPLMSRSVNSPSSSTFSGITNCYECDQCVVSLDIPSIPMMPLFRVNNFFRPPAFGTQAAVYHATAVHSVKAALGGINSCVFAYGQTGSGKTYTLFGDPSSLHHDPGLATRTLEDIFLTLDDLSSAHAQRSATQDFKYTVFVSFMEIYRNKVYCLLSGKGPLRVRLARDTDSAGEGAAIDGLQQTEVSAAAAAHQLLKAGLRRRRVGRTDMNASSSRSHAILQIRVTQWRTNHDTHETMEHSAKINLVDLAGSERQLTASAHQGMLDGIHINQSLTVLSRVINNVACGAKFVNYRDSLLTMILKDSLGGNSKTFMIANISPIALNYEESCATLAYSNAVRHIRNRLTVNCTIHKHLNPLVSGLLPAVGGCSELAEKMGGSVAHLKGVLNCRRSYARTSSVFPMRKEGPSRATNPCRSTLTHRRGSGGCEAFINFTTLGPLRPLLVIFLNHKRLKVTGVGDSDIGDNNVLVRIIALNNDSLELSLAQLIQPNGLVTFSNPQKDMATTEHVMPSLVEKQFMIQKEIARAMEAQITPLLERPLFENFSSESSRSCLSTKDKDEIRTVVGSVSNSNADYSAPDNSVPTSFGFLNFKRNSQDHCKSVYYVRLIPQEKTEYSQGIVDVRVNGKYLGENEHELRHGDTVSVNFRDGVFHEDTQNRLAVYYLDLNHFNGDIVPALDDPSERLGRNTKPLTVGSGCRIEEIQFLQHDSTVVIKPMPENEDSILTEHPFEPESSPKADRVSLVHTNSPSPQVPSDSLVRELSSLPMHSSQGLMCCVSSPSLQSSSKILCGSEQDASPVSTATKHGSWHQLGSTVEEKPSSSYVANHNAEFNPIVERDLNTREGIGISEQRPSNNSSGNAGCCRGQNVTNMLFSDDLRNVSLPEISQVERSITRVSPSSDECEELMVSSARPTVYQDAIFDGTMVACDHSKPLSTAHVITFSSDTLQDGGLSIPPELLKNTQMQYPKFECDTSPRNRVPVLQASLHNLEVENQRLQEENRRYKESLLRFKHSIDDSQQIKAGATTNSAQKPIVGKCLDRIVNQQGRTIEELRKKTAQLEQLVSSKEGEIRIVLRYAEDSGLMSINGDSHFIELHHRIEELISESISKQCVTPVTANSAFPSEFDSTELTALINVSLRIIFNRLKNELYVINKQSLEKMSLMLDTVSQYREAQLSRFTFELREIVEDVVGRPQRTGARWSLTAEDVSTRFVNHYRDRAIETLYSFLIWYDTWELSPNIEHVCAMELIRNADRIVQIARQVRQGGLPRCDTAVTTVRLPEATKQDSIAAISYPVGGQEEEAKQSQKSASFVSNKGKSDPCTQQSQALRGPVSGQPAKVQVCHSMKSSVAKAAVPSRRLGRLDNPTSLLPSSLQAGRPGGPVVPSGVCALKKWNRLVAERKDRIPRSSANICSSENGTRALPVRRNKISAQDSERGSKGVRANRGNLFVRTRSLTSPSSVTSFTRYNTTIPSLDLASAVLGKGFQR